MVNQPNKLNIEWVTHSMYLPWTQTTPLLTQLAYSLGGPSCKHVYNLREDLGNLDFGIFLACIYELLDVLHPNHWVIEMFKLILQEIINPSVINPMNTIVVSLINHGYYVIGVINQLSQVIHEFSALRFPYRPSSMSPEGVKGTMFRFTAPPLGITISSPRKSGWWLSPTPPKNMSQLGWFFPIYGKKCSKPPTRSRFWSLWWFVAFISLLLIMFLDEMPLNGLAPYFMEKSMVSG